MQLFLFNHLVMCRAKKLQQFFILPAKYMALPLLISGAVLSSSISYAAGNDNYVSGAQLYSNSKDIAFINYGQKQSSALRSPTLWGTTASTVDSYLFATSLSDNSISFYKQNPGTGKLTPLLDKPLYTGQEPFSIAVSATNKKVYVANTAENTISIFSVDFDKGSLTLSNTVNLKDIQSPSSITIDSGGGNIYIVDSTLNKVAHYDISSDGNELTFESFVKTGQTPTHLALSSDGKWAFVTNYLSSSISVYQVDQTGGALSSCFETQTPERPENLIVDGPSTTDSSYYIYVTAPSDNEILSYQWANQKLTAIGSAATGSYPYSLIVDQDKNTKNLYVADMQSRTLHEYRLSTQGRPTFIDGIETGIDPGQIVLGSSNGNTRYLYVNDMWSNIISIYQENLSDGSLTFKGQQTTADAPSNMVWVDIAK